MSSQRNSQDFPLENKVNRGAKFMATLRLVYPHADTLCEKDFDWLFDCPQTREFIEWFCSTVTEENVLSPAEVEAYEALLAAGKPILEGNALERALQMCCQVPQLPRMVPEDEGPSQEDLQQELQEQEDYRNRQLWRHEKMKALAANLQQQLRYLEEEEKAVNQDLRKAQMDLEVEIVQTSAVLRQISKYAKQLAEWYGDMGKGQQPALLYEMDLGPYLEVEQQVTDRFEKLIQQILPGSAQAPNAPGESALGEKERLEAGTEMDSDCEIPEERRGTPYQECAKTPWSMAPASQGILVQDSTAELLGEGRNGRDMLTVKDEEERDDRQEAPKRTDTKQTTMPKSLGTDGDELLEDQDSFWKELSQIEKAYICAQREVIVMSAKVEANSLFRRARWFSQCAAGW
ncbi:HAUS augmin-like complex subunit 3 [Heliangelus exortis]|uniref:HAUS augmin-like complex subunit 3 n=1 Tax=Heliangelus exortis TaxID=472823 RepID=UPI003A8CEC1D